MGPTRWRSFTDPPLLGQAAPAPTPPAGVPFLQAVQGLIGPISTAGQGVFGQLTAAQQARFVAQQQTKIELAKIAAETERVKAEARAAASVGLAPPARGGPPLGKLPAWALPAGIGIAVLVAAGVLFRRRRRK